MSEITTRVKKSLFSSENLLKAAYFFVESYYIHFDEDPIERIQAAQDDVSDDELKSILTDWFESHEE